MSETERPIELVKERMLAEHAAGGDNAAVEALYDAYEKQLYGYCHRICRNPEDAADATQEAFCNVIQRLPGLDTANLNFAAYLFTAARNACMDIVKQRGRAEATDEVPEDPFAVQPIESDPERALLTGDQREAARLANDRLPESQRTALALREVSGLSYDEIALTMEMNSNSVAQLISRARMTFLKQLRAGAVIVPPATADAERALTLTSERIDGKITDQDLAWLNTHLSENQDSRLNAEAIEESAVLYRAIGPVTVLASLKGATMAKANALFDDPSAGDGSGSDGGAGAGGGSAAGGAAAGAVVVGGAEEAAASDRGTSHSNRRRAAVYSTVAAIALILALVFAQGEDGEAPVDPAAEIAEPTAATPATSQAKSNDSGEPRSGSQPDGDNPQTAVSSPPDTSTNSSEPQSRSKKKKSSGKDTEADEPSSTPPAAQPTPDPQTQPDPTPPPPGKPPGIPGGPGSICGNPNGCTQPPPVP